MKGLRAEHMILGVDFDGTLSFGKWPEVGPANDNLPEIIDKYGVNSRKISCDFYIDDRALAGNAYKLFEGAVWK